VAQDQSLGGVRPSLIRFLGEQLPTDSVRRLAQTYAVACIKENEPLRLGYAIDLTTLKCSEFLRASRHTAVQMILAAERIADALKQDGVCASLAAPFPRELVHEVARLIAPSGPAVDHLKAFVRIGTPEVQPMAASILHALRIGWRLESAAEPSDSPSCNLHGAYLDRVDWPRVCLAICDLGQADLSHANLTEADLSRSNAARADLTFAILRRAKMQRFNGSQARLCAADLAQVDAVKAKFIKGNLGGAWFDGARLAGAMLCGGADLTNASFQDADLSEADLTESKIDGADFAGCRLEGARLHHLKLNTARFDRAVFARANMICCDLEEMELPEADFRRANLQSAVLTGSHMPCANFRRAKLNNTGLADIDWEGADLREADLRGATFHMGSSRSGKVGSPIASEGSRTGFYTDEFHEQEFKSPEEIRKADLRGANVDGVDFYLVDLRGAKYDSLQEQHFRRCRAILEDRV
jgi:uncharacterized protein YjbI with pentapeptide repeats